MAAKPTTSPAPAPAPAAPAPALNPEPAPAPAVEPVPAETIDVAALTAAPPVRVPTYRVPTGAETARYGSQTLTRGVTIKSGVPALVLVNGTNQTGFPFPAVAIAIMSGLVSREEIRALWQAADMEAAAA